MIDTKVQELLSKVKSEGNCGGTLAYGLGGHFKDLPKQIQSFELGRREGLFAARRLIYDVWGLTKCQRCEKPVVRDKNILVCSACVAEEKGADS